MSRIDVPSRCCRSREQLEDLRLDGDVERGGRLVGDDERRVHDERHRDHHALAHAAGELVRILARALRRARGCRRARASRPRAPTRRACDMPRVHARDLGDLVADGEDRVERGHRLLEDHRDAVAADRAACSRSSSVEQVACPRTRCALPGSMRPGGRMRRRSESAVTRLAAARLADEADRLAGPDARTTRRPPRARRRCRCRSRCGGSSIASSGRRHASEAKSASVVVAGKLPGVERIAQGVAERVAGEHRDDDREPGKEREPPQVGYALGAVLDDRCPSSRRRLHADAEVRQRRPRAGSRCRCRASRRRARARARSGARDGPAAAAWATPSARAATTKSRSRRASVSARTSRLTREPARSAP